MRSDFDKKAGVLAAALWWVTAWAFFAYTLIHPGPDPVTWLAGAWCLVAAVILTALAADAE